MIQIDQMTAAGTGKELFSSKIAGINGSNRVQQIKVQTQVKAAAKSNRAAARRENQISANTLDLLGSPSRARQGGRSVFLNINTKGRGTA